MKDAPVIADVKSSGSSGVDTDPDVSRLVDPLGGGGKTSLHFSPCGEAKCVRGPSGRGASQAEEKGTRRCTCQIVSFTPRSRKTKHGLNASYLGATAVSLAWVFGSRITRNGGFGLSGSLAVRHFFWSEPGPLPWFSRITNHGRSSCASPRRVVRKAG